MKLAISEAQIQAEFYHQAKLAGLTCRLEFQLPRGGRIDVVIVSQCGKGIAFGVELKRSIGGLSAKQLRRYRDKLNVEILTLCSLDEVPRLVERIKRRLPDAVISPWERVLPPKL